MHINKNIFLKKRFWAGILLAQFIAFYIFSKVELIINLFSTFNEYKKQWQQSWFDEVFFSVGDVLYLLLFMAVIVYWLQFFINKKKYITIFFIGINVFYFIYQSFWGMLYFQEPIASKLSKDDIKIKEIKELCFLYLEKCKNTRELLTEDKNGVFVIEDLSELKQEILYNISKIDPYISKKKPILHLNIKPSLYKNIMSYTGIYGYYNPFSGEAQYNDALPNSQIPFTLAHEMAHQIGFAREQEASFVAYLIAKNTKNKDLKYSIEMYSLKSLLYALYEEDPAFVKKIQQNFSDKMKRDYNFEIVYREKYDGILDDFFLWCNDIFLKTNQQKGRISYSYFTELLIKYERDNKK